MHTHLQKAQPEKSPVYFKKVCVGWGMGLSDRNVEMHADESLAVPTEETHTHIYTHTLRHRVTITAESHRKSNLAPLIAAFHYLDEITKSPPCFDQRV